MRSLASGLMVGMVVGFTVAGSIGSADARGSGFSTAGGALAGVAVGRGRLGIGARNAVFGQRYAARARFARGYGFRHNRYGYGFGSLGWPYAGYGSGYGDISPSAGSFGSYDLGLPTSIGIPASPVAPPAIYVLGAPGRMKASGTTLRGRQASRTLVAPSSEVRGETGAVSSGPRIIRVAR